MRGQIGGLLSSSARAVVAHLYHLIPELRVPSRAALRDALGADEPARRAADAGS